MKHVVRAVTCCAVLLALASPAFPEGKEAPDRIALTRAANRIDGTLVLRTDPRLTKALLKRFGGGGWETLGESDPMYKEFAKHPPKNAVLEIEDSRGKVISSLQLENPVARIAPASLIPDRPLVFVTVDHSAGSGSYNGPITSLLEVRDGKFHWIEATDGKTGKSEPIHLMRSLKSDWLTSAVTSGRDILRLDCRPEVNNTTAANQKFLLIYTRYHFDGSKWVKYEKSKEGFWEQGDQRFPHPSEFPKPE